MLLNWTWRIFTGRGILSAFVPLGGHCQRFFYGEGFSKGFGKWDALGGACGIGDEQNPPPLHSQNYKTASGQFRGDSPATVKNRSKSEVSFDDFEPVRGAKGGVCTNLQRNCENHVFA